MLFESGAPRAFTVSGTVGFGSADNLGGATLAVFDTATAQDVLDREGVFDTIDVVARRGGRSRTTSEPASRRSFPEGVEAVTSTTVADEQSDAIKEGLGFFRTFLLVFALDRAVRGLVHHLQHVLDHRGPAVQGARPAAGARREPPPGPDVGRGGGAAGRPRRVGGRHRRGDRHLVRPAGPAGAVQHRPAEHVDAAPAEDDRGVGARGRDRHGRRLDPAGACGRRGWRRSRPCATRSSRRSDRPGPAARDRARGRPGSASPPCSTACSEPRRTRRRSSASAQR